VRGFDGVKDFARKIFLLSIAGRCAQGAPRLLLGKTRKFREKSCDAAAPRRPLHLRCTSIGFDNNKKGKPMTTKNKRIRTAALDLLHALQRILPLAEGAVDYREDIEAAHAAIAQAKDVIDPAEWLAHLEGAFEASIIKTLDADDPPFEHWDAGGFLDEARERFYAQHGAVVPPRVLSFIADRERLNALCFPPCIKRCFYIL
jgi:hypothetical protein